MKGDRPRWARLGLLATTLVLGLTLIATVWTGHRRLAEAAEALAREQGGRWVQTIRRDLEELAGYPSRDELAGLLRRHEGAGLRHVAIANSQGALLVAAGELSLRRDRPEPPMPPGDLARHRGGGLFSLVVPFHRAASDGRPEDGRTALPGSPTREPPALFLTLTFESPAVRRLRRWTTAGLMVGTASALLLTLVALVSGRRAGARERATLLAEHQKRLGALGEMSAVLAHEIRNPLASLKGHSQLLAEQTRGDPSEERKVQRIVSEAVRLEKLTTNLLTFARSGAVQRGATDPVALAEDCRREVGADRISIDGAAAPPRWSLDRPSLRQALTNLMRNAVQASPPGAKVEVLVDSVGPGRRRELRFRIRDQGAGLPEGKEEEIFEPFFTTRSRGTGLGLAVARRIVALHGGTLAGRSLASGGAQFEVRIPRSE